MADIERMFRSELAVHQPDPADWQPFEWDIDPSLDILPAPDPLPDPLALFSHCPPQPTVHLSDLALRPPSDSSADDVSSDSLDLAYPSDSEFVPSPAAVDPSALVHPHPVRPSRRASRSITKVPVPIPNLTKKSRGRKVPTSNGEPVYAASRDKTKKGVRTYTCHADGCGKCFVRGEHLKRHIRSIHTDEKPWTCTYDSCHRAFSRRDNLNQHLRIHKLQDGDD